MVENQITSSLKSPTCMESVNRIIKLPVVQSSMEAATKIFNKVKESNFVTYWTLSTAGKVVHIAVEVGRPIAAPFVHNLEGPIEKVDGVLCSGLDYVEEKVPAVKLPPRKILSKVYHTVSNQFTLTFDATYDYVEPSVKSAYEKIEPAVEKARTIVEPAVEKAKMIIEPAVEKAKSVVEPAVESFAHCETIQFILEEIRQCRLEQPEDNLECEECKEDEDTNEGGH